MKPDIPSWLICEVMAEIQAVIDDYRCGKHTTSQVVEKVERLVNERPLLRAMWSVGYFPQATPPADALH